MFATAAGSLVATCGLARSRETLVNWLARSLRNGQIGRDLTVLLDIGGLLSLACEPILA